MGLCVHKGAEIQGFPLPQDRLLTLLAGHGLSFEQAKLKAIWQNPHLTSVCSLTPNVCIIRANASAAMDERPLDEDVTRSLADYADGTGEYFCRRCGICDTAVPKRIPVFDILEMLMYARGYGAKDMVVKRFAKIPTEIRGRRSTATTRKRKASARRRCR